MARSNMWRKAGNFTPQEKYTEKEPAKKEKTIAKKSASATKHRKNIKISEYQKKSIDAIKRINGMTYDYEAIQLVIDKYMENETDSNKRRFKVFTE